jgi:hypothetical protein
MNKNIDDGGPAFARDSHMDKQIGLYVQQQGMSLRDYFAAAALQGLIASRGSLSTRFLAEDDASYVYEIADAMIKVRKA